MKIDIICVNHNTAPLLQRFLNTLLQSDQNTWDLLISDNGSTDGSVEYLKAQTELPAKYIAYNPNVGYAHACNQLAYMGKNEIIGLFNADIWFEPNHIPELLNVFRDNPNVAILGPKQRNENGQIVHAGIFGSLEDPKHRGWREHDPNDMLYKDFQQCVTVSGSAYLIRRSVWEELTACEIFRSGFRSQGAFLPTMHYYEETWCSYHAHAHDYQVWYDGRLKSLGHTWHASSQLGAAPDQQMRESQRVFRAACDLHQIAHD